MGNRNIPGVYLIYNRVSGTCYVGSSYDIQRRWIGHRSRLRGGTHHSQRLQNSWDKHGESAFALQVLCGCCVDDLLTAEQHWIDFLKPEANYAPVAGSLRGYKFTEKQRLTCAAARGATVTHNGVETSFAMIAEAHGVPLQRLWRRVVKQGMDIHQAINLDLPTAFSTRARKQHRMRNQEQKREIGRKIAASLTGMKHPGRQAFVEVAGVKRTVADIAAHVNVPLGTLQSRRKRGMSSEELLRTANVKNLRDDPARRALWVESIRKGVAERKYSPMSDEGRERQVRAVKQYNATRPITTELRNNISKGLRSSIHVERFLCEGELLSVMDMSERFGVDRHVLRKRLNAGWSVDKATTTPTKKLRRKHER